MLRIVSYQHTENVALVILRNCRGVSAFSSPRPIPLRSTTFADAASRKLAVVDKTAIIADLLPEVVGDSVKYFISRPRKFGKSFVLSTIEEIRKGNKELFKGFAIYNDTPWNKHSVLRFDFSQMEARKTTDVFEQDLLKAVRHILMVALLMRADARTRGYP